MTLARRLFALLATIGLAALPAAEPAAPTTTPIEPTVITSQRSELTSTDTETTVVCDGAVTVTGTNLRITCDHLVVVTTRLGDKAAVLDKLDQLKSLVATGHVRIVQGDREATAGRAEISPGADRLVLSESPVVFDHSANATQSGDRITMFRGERRVIIENSRTTLPGVKDLGPGKDKLLPAPSATPAPTPAPAKP